jgi:hypothetical protein
VPSASPTPHQSHPISRPDGSTAEDGSNAPGSCSAKSSRWTADCVRSVSNISTSAPERFGCSAQNHDHLAAPAAKSPAADPRNELGARRNTFR